MRSEELDESSSVVLRPFESERERAQTAQSEEHLERAGCGTVQLAVLAEVFLDCCVVRDRDACEQVGVPADELGGTVHDDVGTEPKWLLEDGRGERVVDCDERAAVLGGRDDGGEVGDLEERVGW